MLGAQGLRTRTEGGARSLGRLFWLVGFAFAAGSSAASSAIVVSDGSYQRPFCSFARNCVWDVSTKQTCAEKLCKASGYVGGSFNSASGNMCEDSVVSGWHRYFLVDFRVYFFGRVKKETGINATCSDETALTSTALPDDGVSATQEPMTATTTDGPATEEENVVETSTFTTTATVAATTTRTEAPTSTAQPATTASATTALTTTPAPTTAPTTSARTTTAAPNTAPTTLGSTSAPRSEATPFTTVTARATTAATHSSSGVASKTLPGTIDGDILGRLVIATADLAAFCKRSAAQIIVADVLLRVAGMTRDEVKITTSCVVASSGRRLSGTVEVGYRLASLSGGFLRASSVVSLRGASHVELTDAINKGFGQSNVAEVIEHTASVGTVSSGVVASTTTAGSSMSACRGLPSVRNSANLLQCADLPHGAMCDATCKRGHVMSGRISCDD